VIFPPVILKVLNCISKRNPFYAIKKRGKRAEIKPFSSRQELAKHTPAFLFFQYSVTP
jgi:hypothetical protein